jgi:hypothetical protein
MVKQNPRVIYITVKQNSRVVLQENSRVLVNSKFYYFLIVKLLKCLIYNYVFELK